MQVMDMCHVPHGKGSGFESGAGLSISSVRMSSPDGVLGDDTFFQNTLLGVGGVSTFVFCDSRNFLCWIRRLAFLWLWSLICFASAWSCNSSWIYRFSTNVMRASIFGSDGFFISFSGFFFRWTSLTCEHCSTFGLKVNFSFWPLMLSWISPALASMWEFVVLKNGLPRMRGVLVSTSMSSTTKSTGIKKF